MKKLQKINKKNVGPKINKKNVGPKTIKKIKK